MDTHALKVIGFLNKMAEESNFGFKPFSKLKGKDDTRGIIYDDSVSVKRMTGQIIYPHVIADFVSDELHHDIVSTWQDILNERYGLNIVVVEQDDGEMWLELTSEDDESLSITVNHGQWYNDTW